PAGGVPGRGGRRGRRDRPRLPPRSWPTRCPPAPGPDRRGPPAPASGRRSGPGGPARWDRRCPWVSPGRRAGEGRPARRASPTLPPWMPRPLGFGPTGTGSEADGHREGQLVQVAQMLLADLARRAPIHQDEAQAGLGGGGELVPVGGDQDPRIIPEAVQGQELQGLIIGEGDGGEPHQVLARRNVALVEDLEEAPPAVVDVLELRPDPPGEEVVHPQNGGGIRLRGAPDLPRALFVQALHPAGEGVGPLPPEGEAPPGRRGRQP